MRGDSYFSFHVFSLKSAMQEPESVVHRHAPNRAFAFNHHDFPHTILERSLQKIPQRMERYNKPTMPWFTYDQTTIETSSRSSSPPSDRDNGGPSILPTVFAAGAVLGLAGAVSFMSVYKKMPSDQTFGSLRSRRRTDLTI